MMWEYTFLTIKPYVYFLCEFLGFEVLEEEIKVVLVLLFGRWHNKNKQKGHLSVYMYVVHDSVALQTSVHMLGLHMHTHFWRHSKLQNGLMFWEHLCVFKASCFTSVCTLGPCTHTQSWRHLKHVSRSVLCSTISTSSSMTFLPSPHVCMWSIPIIYAITAYTCSALNTNFPLYL